MSSTRLWHWMLIIPLVLLAGFSFVSEALPLDRYAETDWLCFMESGQLLDSGQNPYTDWTFRPNRNPPILLLPFQALSRLPIEHTIVTVRLFSFAAYATLLVLMGRRFGMTPLLLAWSLALAPLWNTIYQGQIYIFLALLSSLAQGWLVDGNDALAGIALGLLVTIKPNFAIWPAFLFLAGHRRPALVSGTVAAALSVLPLPWLELTLYRDWLTSSLEASTVGGWHNVSIPGILQGLDCNCSLVICLGILALLAWRVWSTKPGTAASSQLSILATLFVSPIAWVNYVLLALPTYWEHHHSRAIAVSATLLLIPVPIVYVWPVSRALYALAILLLLQHWAREHRAANTLC